MTARVDQGDWLELASGLERESVDLVYADPPFGTGRVQRTPPGAGALGRESAQYDDGLEDLGGYIAWLGARVSALKPALKATSSVLIHCDWRTSHRVRVLLDELFGVDRFVNHLIWSYGLGGSSPRRFARKHDDILFYCVDPERYWFEPPMVPATSQRLKGTLKKMTDVLDVPSLNNMAAERCGYPTQKPLALLDVLVRSCCPEGGMVLDPCCGSGTTLVAAVRAGRRALGFDLSASAVKTARQRLDSEA